MADPGGGGGRGAAGAPAGQWRSPVCCAAGLLRPGLLQSFFPVLPCSPSFSRLSIYPRPETQASPSSSSLSTSLLRLALTHPAAVCTSCTRASPALLPVSRSPRFSRTHPLARACRPRYIVGRPGASVLASFSDSPGHSPAPGVRQHSSPWLHPPNRHVRRSGNGGHAGARHDGLHLLVQACTRSGVPRRLRLCSYCASHSVGDERHFVFDCIALTPIRVKYLDLFGPTIVTMQQFMWQDNLVRVAHFVFDCFASLQTLGGGQ